MEVRGQLHAPAFLIPPPGKRPRYPLGRRLGGGQSLSGRGVEEENHASARNLTAVVQPVA
jgi:hypothetical protein